MSSRSARNKRSNSDPTAAPIDYASLPDALPSPSDPPWGPPSDDFPPDQRGDCWEEAHSAKAQADRTPKKRTIEENRAAERNGVHSPPPAVETFTAADLMRMEIPPPRWAVDGVLPEGLTILAGKPKLGKSWLALHVALAISSGGVALGRIPVEAGDVLYLALEDTKRRLQSRIRKLLGPTESPSSRLTLANTWPRMDKGGLDLIAAWAEQHRQARAVIIDTWARFRPIRLGKGDNYDIDYADGTCVKAIADKYAIPFEAIHHCRKLGSDDPIEEISGSVGLTGACDGALVLRRERGQHDATLFVTGRDVDEAKLALSFDNDYCLWQLVGDADEHRVTKERADILKVFKDSTTELSAKEVVALTGLSESTVRQRLSRMARGEQLIVTRRGFYRRSPSTEEEPNPFLDGDD
jgi:hypothetical protein